MADNDVGFVPDDVGFVPDAEPAQPQTAGGLAMRFGEQLYNKGIADTIKGAVYGLGGGRIASVVAAPHTQAELKKQGKDVSLWQAQRLNKALILHSIGQDVPTMDVAPPRTLGENIVDVGAGFAAMAAQIAATKKVAPGISDPVAWEAQSLANGGTPGMGAMMGLMFHGINKIPGESSLAKAGKAAASFGVAGGLTKLEGGTWEDAAIVACTAGAISTTSGVASIVKGRAAAALPALLKIAADPDQVYNAPVSAEKLPFVETPGEKPKPSTTSSRLAEPDAADSDDSYFLRSMWSQVRDDVPGKPIVPTPQAFRTALVNRHIALYQRVVQDAKPGGPVQKQATEDLYDTVRAINMLDGVTDPAEGRPTIPPEYASATAPRPPVSLGDLPRHEGETAEANRAFDEAQAKARAKRTQQEEADAWFENYKTQPAQVPERPQVVQSTPDEQKQRVESLSRKTDRTPDEERELALHTQSLAGIEPDEFDAFMAAGKTGTDPETATVVQHAQETGKAVHDVSDEYKKAKTAAAGETQDLTDHERETAHLVGLPDDLPAMELRKSLTLAGKLTPKELNDLRETAGTPDALHRTLQYMAGSGDLPDDPQMRDAYVRNAKEAAADIKKADARPAGSSVMRNLYQTFDKIIGPVERIAGRPLRVPYHNMLAKVQQVNQRSRDLVMNAIKAVVDPKNVKLLSGDNENMAWWLHTGDAKYWNAMSRDAQKIALIHRSIYSGYAANHVRELRFNQWDKYGKAPADVPKADRERILAEGLQAKNDGTFNEWIAAQEWGTRKNYYPSMQEGPVEFDVDDLLRPTRLTESGGDSRGPSTNVNAAHERKGRGTPIKGDVTTNVIRHIASIDKALALQEDMPKFWEDFQRANPSKTDNAVMTDYLNNLVGKPHQKPLDRTLNAILPQFWKYKFLNTFYDAWFFTRDAGRLLAYGPANLQTREAAKALYGILTDRAMGRVDEQRARHAREDWDPRIRQDIGYYNEAMMQDQTLDGRLTAVSRRLAGWSLLGDKGSRFMSWATAHKMAQSNTQLLEAGKIDTATLRSRLMLDSMELSQRSELDNLLVTGDNDTFMRRYAEYKTDAINGQYKTALRGAYEQSAAGRALAGLVVWPRMVYNMGTTNGLKPMYDGFKNGNTGQIIQGLRNVTMLVIGTELADSVYEKVTGKKGTYSLTSLLGFRGGAPGLGVIYDTAGEVRRIMADHDNGNKNTAQTVDALCNTLTRNAQIFTGPISDAIVRCYAASNNAENSDLWKIVRTELDKRYAKGRFIKDDRTAYQSVMHVIFGGFEKQEKNKK